MPPGTFQPSRHRAGRCRPGGPPRAGREFLADPRRLDAQRRDTTKKLATIRACGTTVTEVFGAGPAVAAAVIGDACEISRFPGPDCFAAYNDTAPAGASAGNRIIYRPSLRGNRRLNHSFHMAAVTQIRYQHTLDTRNNEESLRTAERQSLAGSVTRGSAKSLTGSDLADLQHADEGAVAARARPQK